MMLSIPWVNLLDTHIFEYFLIELPAKFHVALRIDDCIFFRPKARLVKWNQPPKLKERTLAAIMLAWTWDVSSSFPPFCCWCCSLPIARGWRATLTRVPVSFWPLTEVMGKHSLITSLNIRVQCKNWKFSSAVLVRYSMIFGKPIFGCRAIRIPTPELWVGGIMDIKLLEWRIERHWSTIIPGIIVILLWWVGEAVSDGLWDSSRVVDIFWAEVGIIFLETRNAEIEGSILWYSSAKGTWSKCFWLKKKLLLSPFSTRETVLF